MMNTPEEPGLVLLARLGQLLPPLPLLLLHLVLHLVRLRYFPLLQEPDGATRKEVRPAAQRVTESLCRMGRGTSGPA